MHTQRAITVFDHKQNKPQTNSVVQCDSHSHTSPAVLYTPNKCPLKRRCHQISLCHVLSSFHSDIELADEITNATGSSHGSLIIHLCTQWTALKTVLPSEVLLPSEITNTCHISPTIQVRRRLARSKSVATWDHRTLPRLTSSCMHMVNVHRDGFPIRNYLLLIHQFYAHK